MEDNFLNPSVYVINSKITIFEDTWFSLDSIIWSVSLQEVISSHYYAHLHCFIYIHIKKSEQKQLWYHFLKYLFVYAEQLWWPLFFIWPTYSSVGLSGDGMHLEAL